MAVYTWGLVHGDVTSALAYLDGGVDADSEPGTAEITRRISERSAEINGEWYGAKGSYPDATLATTDETTHTRISGIIRMRVAADYLAANQREDAMTRYIDEYDRLIEDLRAQASRVAGATGASETALRSHFSSVTRSLKYRGSQRWRDPRSFS